MFYQKEISRAYSRKLNTRLICIGDVILTMVGHVQKKLSASKLTNVAKEAYNSGYFFIDEPGLEELLPPINAKWLKVLLLKGGRIK